MRSFIFGLLTCVGLVLNSGPALSQTYTQVNVDTGVICQTEEQIMALSRAGADSEVEFIQVLQFFGFYGVCGLAGKNVVEQVEVSIELKDFEGDIIVISKLTNMNETAWWYTLKEHFNKAVRLKKKINV